jgi:hypothetical protein
VVDRFAGVAMAKGFGGGIMICGDSLIDPDGDLRILTESYEDRPGEVGLRCIPGLISAPDEDVASSGQKRS